MSLIGRHIQSLERASDNLEKVAEDSIVKNMEFIMFLIKEKQLGKSILSDGSLAPTYHPDTIQYATFDIPRTGTESKSSSERYNFEWSGKWMDSLYLSMEKGGFDILARDSKTAMLENMVGGKITALTKENNNKVNEEIIMPELFDSFIDALLKF